MPKLNYRNTLPPEGEFQKALATAMSQSNPVTDLLELANDLWEYEQKYQLSSPDFYEQYQSGLLDDELQHCTEWAITYDLFMKTRRKVEAALMRTAIQPEFATTMP